MRRIATIVALAALAMSGCRHLQTMNVNVTLSPTVHLEAR